MASIRTNIRSAITTAILGMKKADGYAYDWVTVQQPNTALGGFPRALVYLGNEVCNDTDGGTIQHSYQCTCDVVIEVEVKLSAKTAVPMFAIDSYIDDAIDDLKRLFGKNPSLNGVGNLPVLFVSMEVAEFASGDTFVSKKFMTNWSITYMQSRTEPTIISY